MFLTIALSGALLFSMGYYLGNQVGSTAHIRAELARMRANRQGTPAEG